MMYTLMDNKRNELRKIMGELITEDDIDKKEMKGKIVSVGDMVTATLKKHGIEPDISIVDYKIERKKCGHELKNIIREGNEKVKKVRNPQKKITDDLWNAIEEAYARNEKVRIEVEGEDDLAALPAICLAPPDTTVMYGLPSRGIVFVEVGDDERKKVWSFLKKMEE
ncbi:MAG: DUF359 domain-containing protein [Candidatus Thermoplasmatota archaeon]|nr:DUF359 domain-containing protein [Candidatus Thermoplasmatota archaeon]